MKEEDSIKQYIATNLLFTNNGFPYSDEVSFLEEGIVDSTGVLELVAFVEGKYKVHIDGKDVIPDNFDSVKR